MVGIGRALEIPQVAGNARIRRQIVVVVDVAIGASPRRNRMATGQDESRRAVVEFCVQPIVGSMAGFAGGGELGVDVIGIHCTSEVGLVAGIARRR